MIRWYSEYSNQVHLLNISLSKHLWMKKDESFSYQKKPIQPEVERHRATPRMLLRRYLLVDHYSGLFYVGYEEEFATPSVGSFLASAWAAKPNHPLQGIPELLFVPKQFADGKTRRFLQDKGVELKLPYSGFQSGIRPLVDWNRIELHIGWGNYTLQENEWRFGVHVSEGEWIRKGNPPRGLVQLNDLAESLATSHCQSLGHTDKWVRGLDKRAPSIPPTQHRAN